MPSLFPRKTPTARRSTGFEHIFGSYIDASVASTIRIVQGSTATKANKRIMENSKSAKFQIGQIVKHRIYPFRGVIFDVDPTFNNTEEWWLSIPEEIRPGKDQPFYHLFAENDETEYVAYVSEQNLVPDLSEEPLRHPDIPEIFDELEDGIYRTRNVHAH